MGNILGLVIEFIPLLGGIYALMVFGGYKIPKFNTEKDKEKFTSFKQKHGKKFVALSIFVIILSGFRIGTFLLDMIQ